MIGNTSPIEAVSSLCSALSHAPKGFVRNALRSTANLDVTDYDMEDMNMHIFGQVASDTACGWGGIAGHAFTNFYLVVIEFPRLNVAAVYVNRIAYICKMDDRYKEFVVQSQMPLWDEVEASGLDL